MFWVSKILAPLALVVGVAGTIAFMSNDAAGKQPPFGKGGFGKGGFGKGGFPFGKDEKKEDKKDFKKDEKKEDKKESKKDEKRDGRREPAAKSDATVDAWLKVLLEKITDPHDTVRESARGAIIAVGAPALPALEKLADGTDPAKAVAARKLIASIRGGRGAQAGGPGPRGPGAFFGAEERGRGPERERNRERGPGRNASEVAPRPREVARN